MNSPTTARDAAVKVLMADFAELLARLETAQTEHRELQETQRLCHTELEADLVQLGGLVESARTDTAMAGDAGRAIVAAAQRLESAAARIEAGTHLAARRQGAALPNPRAAGKSGAGLVVFLVVLLLCVGGWAGYATVRLVQQKTAVQYGTATLKAWPALDEGARRTIRAAGSQ